jgi:Zn finger protein HypA/HybF involved in hydrogenase expression
MGTLPHIRKLDDGLGLFLVRITCRSCHASREVKPESLARLAGWSATFAELATRMRCSRCGSKDAEVVAVRMPRPRGIPKNPH